MITERTVFSLCEVLPSGVLRVRLANQILDAGTLKSQTLHRYCLVPGSDLSGQPEQVVKIANAVWTPEVIDSYNSSINTQIK